MAQMTQGEAHRLEVLRLRPGESRSSVNASVGMIAIRSQYEVARILNVSHQTVAAIERRALWKIRRRLLSDYQDLLRHGSFTGFVVPSNHRKAPMLGERDTTSALDE